MLRSRRPQHPTAARGFTGSLVSGDTRFFCRAPSSPKAAGVSLLGTPLPPTPVEQSHQHFLSHACCNGVSLPPCQKCRHCPDKGDEERKPGSLAFFLLHLPAGAAPTALLAAVPGRGSRGVARGPLAALAACLAPGWGISTDAIAQPLAKLLREKRCCSSSRRVLPS